MVAIVAPAVCAPVGTLTTVAAVAAAPAEASVTLVPATLTTELAEVKDNTVPAAFPSTTELFTEAVTP
jgi:hypothetical protein